MNENTDFECAVNVNYSPTMHCTKEQIVCGSETAPEGHEEQQKSI